MFGVLSIALGFVLLAPSSVSAQTGEVEVAISFEPGEVDGVVDGGGVAGQYDDLGLVAVDGLAIDSGQGSDGSHALGPSGSEFCCPEATLTFTSERVIGEITLDLSGGRSTEPKSLKLRVTAFAANGSTIGSKVVPVDQVRSGDPIWTTVSLESSGPAIVRLVVSSRPENPESVNDYGYPWYIDNVRYTLRPQPRLRATSAPTVAIDAPYNDTQVIELVESVQSDGTSELSLAQSVVPITGVVIDLQPLTSVLMESPAETVDLCRDNGCERDTDGRWGVVGVAGEPLMPPPIEGSFELSITARNGDDNTRLAVLELEGRVVETTIETTPSTADAGGGGGDAVDETTPSAQSSGETEAVAGATTVLAPNATDVTRRPPTTRPEPPPPNPVGGFIVLLVLLAVIGWVGYRLIRRFGGSAQHVNGNQVFVEEAVVRARLDDESPSFCMDPAPEVVIHAVLNSDVAHTLLVERDEP